MKKQLPTLRAMAALAGLGALAVYILACAAFSPDDKKVLYPVFDGPAGRFAIACYDRVARRSEVVFAPVIGPGGKTNQSEAPALRAEWLADGKRVVVGWQGGDEDPWYRLVLMPVEGRGPARYFQIPGKDFSSSIMLPPPIIGDQVFLGRAPNDVLRLDLRSGEVVTREVGKGDGDWLLYPSADGKGLLYLAENKPAKGYTFGRMDPATFAATPILTITNTIEEAITFASDRSGRRVVFAEDTGEVAHLVVEGVGQPAARFAVSPGPDRFRLGCTCFSRDGTVVFAAFQREEAGGGAALGLAEVPLSGGVVRETVLLHTPEFKKKKEDVLMYFQFGFSHDGKAAAVSTTYIAGSMEGFHPQDCALFFIDLTSKERTVTKVPIPMPARPEQSGR